MKPFLLGGQQECGRYPILDRNVPVDSAGAMPWVHYPSGVACCGPGAVQRDFGCATAALSGAARAGLLPGPAAGGVVAG